MPKVRRSRAKPPPAGWDQIEPTLTEMEQKMRESKLSFFSREFHFEPAAPAVENKPHDGLRKNESLWPIFRLHHQRSRYLFELFYKRKAISRELYDYCVKEGYADQNLIAKWRKVCTAVDSTVVAFIL